MFKLLRRVAINDSSLLSEGEIVLEGGKQRNLSKALVNSDNCGGGTFSQAGEF